MAVYVGHSPKVKKVSNGLVFSDDFNRINGPVGNSWESVGPDSSAINTNNLKIDANTASQTSGVFKPVFSEPTYRESCEIFVRLETLTKNTLTGAKAVIAVYKDAVSALLIEIVTGNNSATWDDDKDINVTTYVDGLVNTVTSVSRTIDTTTADNLFRISITQFDIKINYLVNGQFDQINEISANHGFGPMVLDSKVGLFAYESEINYESIEIRSHEKVYIYGLPNTWYVDIGSERFTPEKGIITLDTSYMELNVNDMYDITLASTSVSPATLTTIDFDFEVRGGDGLGMFNYFQLANPAGGGIPAGKVSTASRKVRKPLVYLNAEWAPITVLDYLPTVAVTAVPIRVDRPGTINVKFKDFESGATSLFTSYLASPNIDNYITISARDLPQNRKMLVIAEFEPS